MRQATRPDDPWTLNEALWVSWDLARDCAVWIAVLLAVGFLGWLAQ